MSTSGTDLLRAYVNSTSAADETLLASCWEEAGALVTAYIGSAGATAPDVVPPVIVQRATLEVASELFHRRNAPGGIAQFATIDGAAPARLARDPMLGAYPLLSRFLPAGLA